MIEKAQHSVDICEVIENPLFKKFHSLGLIDEIALRNALIKKEYKILRKDNSTFDAIFILSEKFNLSDSAINTILFRKRIKKKVFTGI